MLLASLQIDDLLRLEAQLTPTYLKAGDALFDDGELLSDAYFPATAIISLLQPADPDAYVEIATIGSEGFAGVSLVLGVDVTPARAVVQQEGWSFRLPAVFLKREFSRAGSLQRVALRYAHSLLGQVAQIAACNRRHTIEAQLSRWLLTSLDRSETADLTVKQDHIAKMLGVRREGITEAARRLHRAGLIEQTRGHIVVVDRIGLEETACACYEVLKRQRTFLPHASQRGTSNRHTQPA